MNYWKRVEDLDVQMAEVFKQLKETEDNEEHKLLTDRLYDLKQEKIRVQRERGKQVIKDKGLRRF